MHADNLCGVGLFDEEFDAMNQEVGAKDTFDDIQNTGVGSDAVGEGKNAMGIEPSVDVKRFGQVIVQPFRLNRFQFSAQCDSVLCGHHRDRE